MTRPHGTRLRLAVINDTSDRANWGCRATSGELANMLHRASGMDRPPHLHRVPLLDRRLVDKFLEKTQRRRLGDALANPQPSVQDLRVIHRAVRLTYPTYLAGVRDCDAVVFQSEGSMTGCSYVAGERLLLLPHAAKLLFDKPVFSLNQTLYTEDERFADMLRNVLQHQDGVWVREPASQLFAQRIGLTDTQLLPDMAFHTTPEGNPREWIDPPVAGDYFCVSGSAILKRIDHRSYVDVLRRICQTTDLTPVFVFSANADRRFLTGIVRRGETPFPVHVVRAEADYPQVAAVIGGARFLVTGRYHMAILAAVTHTPFIPLATNTHKNAGLLSLLAYPMQVRSFDDVDAIVSDAARVLAERASLVEALRRAMGQVHSAMDAGERELQRRLRQAVGLAGPAASAPH